MDVLALERSCFAWVQAGAGAEAEAMRVEKGILVLSRLACSDAYEACWLRCIVVVPGTYLAKDFQTGIIAADGAVAV